MYVDQTRNASAQLVEFLRWSTHEGQEYVKELKFVPLPRDLVKRIDDKLGTIRYSQK